MMRFKLLSPLSLIVFAVMGLLHHAASAKELWINSTKADCVGVAPRRCLLVKSALEEPWSFFYQDIEGFRYEPGYIYHLEIEVISLDPTTVPADASSLRYKLIQVKSKELDPLMRLNDIWALTHVGDKVVAPDPQQASAYIELNTRKMMLLGSDGCNNLNAKLNDLNDAEISFGPIVSTRKACASMELPKAFNAALIKVRRYQQEPGGLQLMADDGQVLLRFKKVD